MLRPHVTRMLDGRRGRQWILPDRSLATALTSMPEGRACTVRSVEPSGVHLTP